jgi:uncharacterized membrane protein YqjE
LLKTSLRQSRDALRIVGGLTLVGVFLHVLWLIAPTFGHAAVIAAVVVLIAVVGLGIGISNRAALRSRRSVYVE